ncbi:hypothetical protein ACR782_07195 [Sphingobacterium spiritivorum]|uniref:hypothetical protein n=1 Tax=Sphingobacterium spiritivorum TaxID=258 RepID=UPI003DA26686
MILKFCTVLTFIILIVGCDKYGDTFRSKELVSSKGEKLYINTLNWGINDDNQYTIITKDADRLKDRTDTVDAINGLLPFVYRFSGDTLSVFYLKWRDISIKEKFKSIKINYNPLENRDYMNLINKAGKGQEGYQLVP